MVQVAFKLSEAQTLVLDVGEAAQLAVWLAVFGRDEEMPRSRRLAEKIATGIELAFQGEPPLLQLSEFQREDVRSALDAMIDSRSGQLPADLERLRAACRAHSPGG